MERISIYPHNLSEQDCRVNEFKALFGNALKTAPSDASLCCCITAEDGGYTLNMRIHSASGHFPIHSRSNDIDELVEMTTQKMCELFKDWHNNPKNFLKDHKLGEKPCFHNDGKVMACPQGSYANRKFEK